jgi:hypothetical protein
MVSIDEPAPSPFLFADCFIVPKPTGRMATNLRELLEAVQEVDDSVLRYHMWQYRMAITAPGVEYPNDFASWTATAVLERPLAEKLSAVDPFSHESMEQVRETLTDIMEEYVWDLPYPTWVRSGFELHFCEAATVVLRSTVAARTFTEFCGAIGNVGLDSIYYHSIDARWRLRSIHKNDFSNWIEANYGLQELAAAIQDIDVSFYTLKEIRTAIMELCKEELGKFNERTE